MNKLNKTAKQAFYNARKRNGDVNKLSTLTGYSASHITNVINGYRTTPQLVADEMFRISRRRVKNIEFAY